MRGLGFEFGNGEGACILAARWLKLLQTVICGSLGTGICGREREALLSYFLFLFIIGVNREIFIFSSLIEPCDETYGSFLKKLNEFR